MLKYMSIFTITAISMTISTAITQAGEVSNKYTIDSRQSQQNFSKNNVNAEQGGDKKSTTTVFQNGQQVVPPPAPVNPPTPRMSPLKRN